MGLIKSWAMRCVLLVLSLFHAGCWNDDKFGEYQAIEIFYFSQSGKLYAGTDGTGLYRLAESEKEWISVGLKRLRIRDFSKLNTHYYVATTGGVFRSKYLDIPWKRIDRGMPNRTTSSYALEKFQDRMYVGTGYGVYWIPDKGLTWTKTALPHGVFSMRTHGDSLYAGTAQGFFRTEDGGATWNNTGLQGLGISCMEVRDGRLVVGTSEIRLPDGSVLRGDGIFYSDDNGSSWTHSEDLRTVHILDIASVEDAIFAAGGVSPGVYRLFRSLDRGETWERMFTGTVDLTPISLAYTGLRLYSGTPSTGIYYSDDGGNTWTEYNSGLPRN